jgi:ComF family protein
MIKRLLGKMAIPVASLFNAIYSQRCYFCERHCEFYSCLCKTCKLKLELALHKPVQVYDVRAHCELYVLSDYTTLVGECIKKIKYKPSRRLLKNFRKLLVENEHLSGFLRSDDILIPVPMGVKRKRRRGFNQATELAQSFAKHYGCQFSEPLVRLKVVKAQAECQEEERLTNLDNVFGLSSHVSPQDFKGRRLVIIDDVATTGTTVNKCAEALAPLEPAKVIGLVITHSYKRTQRSNP